MGKKRAMNNSSFAGDGIIKKMGNAILCGATILKIVLDGE
jgi:hypothetical protein